MTRKIFNLTKRFSSLTSRKKNNNNSTTNDTPEYSESKNDNYLNPEFEFPVDISSKPVSYFQLFRYSTLWDRVIIIFGLFLSTIGSIGVPYSVITYGEFTSLLVDRSVQVGTSTPTYILNWFGGGQILTNASAEENRLALIKDSEAFGIASLAGAFIQFILCLIGVDLINYIAAGQIDKIRKLFFESILRQDMTWYDLSSKNSNFASKMTDDLDKIKEGIGEKIAIFTFLVMSFITSVIFSFFYGWKLTLVVLSCTPVIIISTALVAKVQSSLTEKELKSYSIAGGVAEEVFSGIRTVVAFSGEKKETERYASKLIPAEKTGIRKGLFSGIGSGVMWFIIHVCNGLALWYGVKLIIEDSTKETPEYTAANLVIVLFGVLIGAQNLGFTAPHVEAFAAGQGAATTIFSIIDRKSKIDPMSREGETLKNVDGSIEFENIHFQYPARPDIQILKGLNLKVKAGHTVAFVGPSGCGKSTCLQLLQRLYDPMRGTIKLDGTNTTKLNVSWLRSTIGVVGQEPVLFDTSIGENIRYGKPNATQEEIEEAARIANCHTFIMRLPSKYDTLVGERGAQLSGGQKQRIAIARAIIRDPKILLLDEATSALDPTSEKRVQDALEEASKGRTTLVVSHRLSTVTNANKIVFIKDGVVAEEGTHEELMENEGLYYDLVMTAKRQEEDEDEDDDDENSYEEFQATKSVLRVESVLSTNLEDAAIDSEEQVVDQQKYKVKMWGLMKLNAPEWHLILIGCIAAIVYGASMPAFAILFGEFYGILALPDNEEISRESEYFAYLFILLGVIAGAGTMLQFYMFNIAGVRLTTRLRKMTFKTIISQEMAWFDEKDNSVGALCARLSGDCANIQGATGSRIGSIVQALATLFIGVIISFFFSWNLTLVTIITVPFVFASMFFESRYINASVLKEKAAIENASQMAVEAISNIRTVTSLGQEPHVLNRYNKEIAKITRAVHKKTRFRGCVFSLGQTVPLIAYGVCLYYGGLLVANDGLEYKNVIKVSEALIFGAYALGQALAYAPNVNAATSSAAKILKLIERPPKMHNPAQTAFNTAEKADGDITYQNVEFRYPNRPKIPILRGLNLKIEKGSTVALVGPSGCGKSTCIQLLLRYYDPDDGSINLADVPTTDFPINTLRSQLGLVSQEPVLFDKTIAENIAYGDNFRDISMQEIIDAARKSNIHDFIKNLPLGYDTSLGNKGAQLSGGQKQRIAIARALVRNPKILILDEATSALDMHSEKIVQDALDAARSGRTCITIAHRLTTIQNADVICVIKTGRIVEKGNHEELMKLNGKYAELYRMQQIP